MLKKPFKSIVVGFCSCGLLPLLLCSSSVFMRLAPLRDGYFRWLSTLFLSLSTCSCSSSWSMLVPLRDDIFFLLLVTFFVPSSSLFFQNQANQSQLRFPRACKIPNTPQLLPMPLKPQVIASQVETSGCFSRVRKAETILKPASASGKSAAHSLPQASRESNLGAPEPQESPRFGRSPAKNAVHISLSIRFGSEYIMNIDP